MSIAALCAPTAGFMQDTAPAITPLDNYEQWKSALDTGRGVVAPTFTVMPGYAVDTVRVAGPDEGSWIAAQFDRTGRLIIAREKRGLLRLSASDGFKRADVIENTLEEVRGLVDTPDGLFANANVSRGFFRLRETRGSGFDEIKPLITTRSGGHGRNALSLGPDGLIYMIHGDSVDLPPNVRRLTPPTVPRLLPGDDLPRGHLLRTDGEGREWTLVSGGLRNPVGVDFNTDGEAFTYDADAETDMGMPWYRPTHVRHLVSGADFGWRRVTGRWPPYYLNQPDNPPTTLVIGKGSPTAVKFGTRSHFPPLYQRALFILDWAYGRILAVHLTPHGASYTGRAELFLRGRPLNVTGVDFGPDGAMYFVTGGRNTQSALYRVRYTGPKVSAPAESQAEIAQRTAAAKARAFRKQLEAYHGRHDAAAIPAAWALLDHADPWIAHAARVALEHQPVEAWVERALSETSLSKSLVGLLALTRVGPNDILDRVLQRLNEFPLGNASVEDARVFVRTAQYAVQRLVTVDVTLKTRLIEKLDPLVPHTSGELNREACRLLIQLDAPSAVRKASALLAAAVDQEEKIHYLHILGSARSGWTEESRARFFRNLSQTGTFRGGAGLPRFLREIRNDALATVPESDRARFAALLDAPQPQIVTPPAPSRPRELVKEWSMHELIPQLGEVNGRRNLSRGRQVFGEAACIACHRMGHEGGTAGPDLTDVGSRFGPRDLLESTLEPSRVIADSYRAVTVKTQNGDAITGRIVPVDYRLPVLRIARDLLRPDDAVDVAKDDIVSYAESEVSPMPSGLLDRFSRDEILDLLAFLSGDAANR